MTPRRGGLDFERIVEPVARALFGEPVSRYGNELRFGKRSNPALAVRLDSATWWDFKANKGGGVLDLPVHAGEASDRAGAARWLKSQRFADDALGARERRSAPRPASRESGGGEGRSMAHAGVDEASRREEARRRDAARRLWNSTRSLSGTVAESYLRARGVENVVGVPALRFHPRLRHREADEGLPALVAGVQSVEGHFVGVHRTYLHAANKAEVSSPRLSLGPIGGGAVRLVEVADDTLLVGEGIETTAAAVKVLGWRGGAWAALSTSGLCAAELPEHVRHVTVAADRDAKGGGQLAAAALAERLEGEGRHVAIELPPFVGDWNDVLILTRGAA